MADLDFTGEIDVQLEPDAGDDIQTDAETGDIDALEEGLLDDAPDAEDADDKNPTEDGTEPGSDDEEPTEPEAEPEYAVVFKTQDEFDRVIGARIAQAEKKFQRENAALIELGRLTLALNSDDPTGHVDPQAVYDKVLEQAYASAGIENNFQRMMFQNMLKSIGVNGLSTQHDQPQEFTPEQIEALHAEELEIRKTEPDFDFAKMLEKPEVAVLALNGFSIARIREIIPSQSQLEAEYKRGQEDAIKNMQKRKALPKPEKANTRTKELDFSAMSDEEFAKIDREISAGRIRL